jgi:hypothetical protein
VNVSVLPVATVKIAAAPTAAEGAARLTRCECLIGVATRGRALTSVRPSSA